MPACWHCNGSQTKFRCSDNHFLFPGYSIKQIHEILLPPLLDLIAETDAKP